MSLNSGERQVAPTIEGIRRDHVARYEWAASRLNADGALRIADLACGVGYGSYILASAGCRVFGMDRNVEAIAYARQHYKHKNASFRCCDIADGDDMGDLDAVVCFETIEHIKDPLPLLQSLHRAAPRLIASVPNEDVMPYGNGYAFHFRHYAPDQFEALLNEAGWRVTQWFGQAGPRSEVEPEMMGRTIIAVCERAEAYKLPAPSRPAPRMPSVKPPKAEIAAPAHVAIVGIGPSSAQYARLCSIQGGRHRFCDETWTINAFGDVLACDRVFHMDDVRIQQIRADARPESNIAAMLEWLKTHPGPVVTSQAHPDYPGLVEFPLEDVLNDCPFGYFNSTAAYAVAYAIHIGVKKITLFGCDFSYEKSHDAEKGRACVEFWLGMAVERGILISVPKNTTLLDACSTQAERFYGYDCVDIDIKRVSDRIKVEFSERSELPSADDVEHAYDHSRPTVPDHLREAPEAAAFKRAPEVK